ncbi:MAG: 2-amino-4-hydroxy-6-hydroxymethyldihydropteridine diphosphokinase [Planctomycetaceae bacterium]
MTRCCIALGGNLGPVRDQFCEALGGLRAAGLQVSAVSRLYQTAPVATGDSGVFLNAAALVETDLAPEVLLDRLHALERAAGRTRERRWGPRTLDLDLIFYADAVIEGPRLVVPHPHAWYRRFVLNPLADIAADFVHPLKRVTVAALRDRLLPRPLVMAFAGAGAEENARAAQQWHTDSSAVRFLTWRPPAGEPAGAHEPTFIVWCGGERSAAECGQKAAADPSNHINWSDLPLVPRIDASCVGGPVEEFVRYLLDAALGSVRAIALPHEWWRD